MRRPATIRHMSSLRSVTVLIHRSVTGRRYPVPVDGISTVLSGTGDSQSHVGGSGTRTGISTLAMGFSPFVGTSEFTALAKPYLRRPNPSIPFGTNSTALERYSSADPRKGA